MRKILVVVDPEETQRAALNRIEEIPVSNVQIKVVYYVSQLVSAKEAGGFIKVIGARKVWLEALIQPFVRMGYHIRTEVQPFDILYEAILQSAYEFEADFVIKSLRRRRVSRRVNFSSSDWNLIRFCPSPLLLVNSPGLLGGKPIIAALDLVCPDEAHKALNKIVLNQSKLLADVLQSDIHLVNAYRAISTPGGVDSSAYQVIQGRREELLKRARRLAKAFRVLEDNVHICEASADLAINRCVTDLDAGVIVMGTVSGSGIPGAFIGNTAETVMEHARCDIFLVKPDDFESPISLIDANSRQTATSSLAC